MDSEIPFVRPRTITGVGECFRPNTRLYVSLMAQMLVHLLHIINKLYNRHSTTEGGTCNRHTRKVEFSFRIPEYDLADNQIY